MKKLGILISIFVLTIMSISPSAFAGGWMSRYEIQVWPEYDDPRILIMQAGQGVTGSKKATAYFPNATQGFKILNKVVTSNNDDPAKYNQKYTTKNEGNYIATTFDIPNKEFFAEGYWDGYAVEQDKKTFTYVLKMPFNVNQTIVYFQKPATATDYKITPKPQYSQAGKDGLEVSSYTFNNKKAGEEIKFTVSYTKNDNKLSSTEVKNTTTNSSGGSQPTTSTTDTAVVILVALGLGFLIAGGFALYSNKRNGVNQKNYNTGRGSLNRKGSLSSGGDRSTSAKNKPGSKKVSFCPNCGAQAQDKFCSHCGQKIR